MFNLGLGFNGNWSKIYEIMKKIISTFSILLILGGSGVKATTLRESMDLALKNNPSVRAIQNKLEASSARLNQALGAFLPTIKLDGNYGRSYSQPSSVQITTLTTLGAVTENLSFGTDAATDAKGWTASLSQPLFVAALFPGYQIALRSVDIAKEDLNKTIQDLKYNVTVAYFGLLSAEKFVKLSNESLQMANSHLDQVSAMLKSGISTKADLLRTEVQAANSEAALTKARNAFEIAKISFNAVLGINIDSEIELTEEISEKALPHLPDHQALLKTALDNRPDWKQFNFTRSIAEENLSVARSSYFPSVFLSGQTGNRISQYPTYNSDVSSWSITGAASWTLFDGLGIQNRINEAAANLKAQNATEEQVKNGIALEVRDAYLNLKSALELLDSAKKAVDLAQESHKVSTLRFNSGVGTNLEVLDAQVALTGAWTNYIKALFDIEIGKAKVNKIVGKEIL